MKPQRDQQDNNEVDSYCHYGCQTLLKLVPTLESQIEGVVEGEDVECVHKIRVASRRIRAALPMFKECFPPKKYRKWLKQIKQITKFFGEARDLDVQISFTQEYLKNHQTSSSRASVESILDNLIDRRKNIQETVPNEIKKFRDSDVLEKIDCLCTKSTTDQTNAPFDSQATLQEAYGHISAKMQDFLDMEFCVHNEEDILNHHKMRIRGKWLRYTMEVFSPLYADKLSSEIKLAKQFQDTLGEMHDCDVWVESIPKLEAQNKIEDERKDESLSEFTAFVKQRRKTLYTQFVKLWDENKAKGSFEQINRTLSFAVSNGETVVKQALQNPGARIGVLADIHSNLDALKAVFKDAEKRGVTIFLNAGDLTGFGAFPNQVIQLLNEKKTLSVMGNIDLEILEGTKKADGERKLALKFTQKELTKPSKAYLRSLPKEITFEVSNRRLLMVHGSPKAIDEHIYKDTPAEKLAELGQAAQADIIIVGHSHEQFLKKTSEASFINPGSVGRPYDGKPQAAYAIVTFNPFTVELLRVDYDVKAAASAIRQKKLPESLAQSFLQGLPSAAIKEEDRTRNQETQANYNKIITASERLAGKYLKEVTHPSQVKRIGLKIFDDLKNLHNLGNRERFWLGCATLLHDIGLSADVTKHHKASLELILDDIEMPFSSEQRRIIGSIARYHRRGCPKNKHYNLACLDKETKQKIAVLSSILRVADALDYTHQSIVSQVIAKDEANSISIECMVNADPIQEEQAINKKKDLFEEVFAKKLVLTWKK